MQYQTLLALLSAPLLSLAQSGANPFNIPPEGLSASGGEPLELNWEPTTDGTVTLVLRSGSSNDLNEGTVIESGLDNSGSYTWTPSNDLTRGSDYTVEIVDDDDPSNVNYTPYFVLDTDTTTAQQTSVVSLGQPTTTPDLSTASPTGDATTLTDLSAAESTAESTATETETDTEMMTTMTGSCKSQTRLAPNSLAQETNRPRTATAQETGMSTMQSSGASASATASMSESASGASESASSTEDLNAPEQSGNAGSKKNVAVGMLGAVALGALAL